MSVLFWFLSVLHSDGSWWVRCLTAVPEPEWPSVRLTSARSGMSARAPATWPTACERQPTYHQVTDCQVTIGSDLITAQAHDTKHTDSDGRISPPPATSVLSPLSEHQPGTLHGCSVCTQWLRNIREVLLTWSAHLTNLKSSLTSWHVRDLTPAGVIRNQWCSYLYCIFFCLTALPQFWLSFNF